MAEAKKKKKKKKSPAREVERNLVASTGHITWNDQVLLTADADAKTAEGLKDVLLVYNYPEGFFVYCSSDPDSFEEDVDSAKEAGYSGHLVALMRLTRRNRCKFLHLDADGPCYEDCKVFDWVEEQKTGKPVETAAPE